jgi:hypothetical protein
MVTMANMSEIPTVWVFNGAHSRFPSAVFSSEELASTWIREHTLSGTLTRYPVDVSAYDWAVGRGYFVPRKKEHTGAEVIRKFTAASQEHYHYEAVVEGA